MAGSSKKVIYAALAGNSLIAITKFVAATITGSSAMIAEGIHSLVDTGNQVLLLYGLKRAARPPDARFPFGHGKEIYFWSFVVAILIFAVGAGLSIFEGIRGLLDPHPLQNVHVNYIVLGIAMVFESGALYVAVKEFGKVRGRLGYIEAVQRGKDPTMFVVLFEDSAALAGLVVAFVGIWLGEVTGIVYFDGIASIIIGLILGATAIWLAYETKSLLIGESADPQIVSAIREVVQSHPIVLHLNEVATLHMGPSFIVVNISLDFVDGISSEQVESCVSEINRKVKGIDPSIKRVFIEAEARKSHAKQRGD